MTMNFASAAAWDDEYAKLAHASSQLRTTSSSLFGPGATAAREAHSSSIQLGIDRLRVGLRDLEGRKELIPPDITRRTALLDGLSRQVQASTSSPTSAAGGASASTAASSSMSSSNPSASAPQVLSTTAMAMKQQDDMIGELADGVGRLKDQTLLINDEARLHNRLLDDMSGDVEAAREGMESETARMERLREERSVWRLYMIIAGLSVLLVLLLLMGLS